MSRNTPVPEEAANKIWDILIEHAGRRGRSDDGDDWARESFTRKAVEGDWSEYSFYGDLGSGGKIFNLHREWRVSCYSEDSTPARDKIIEVTNAALVELHQQTYS